MGKKLGIQKTTIDTEFLKENLEGVDEATFYMVISVHMEMGTMGAKVIHREGQPPDPVLTALVLNQIQAKSLQDAHALAAQASKAHQEQVTH